MPILDQNAAVVFRPLIPVSGEHGFRIAEFNQFAHKKEAALVRYARGLLHIMRHDDDRVLVLQCKNQFLDLRRRNGIQCGAGLVHENDLRLHGQSPRDTEPLLLATGEAERAVREPIFHLVPESGALQAGYDKIIEQAPVTDSVQPRPIGHVIVDRFRKRIGFLKDHPDPFTKSIHVDSRVIHVRAVQFDPTLQKRTLHQIV